MQLHVHAHTHTNMRSPLVHFLPLPLFLSFWHSMSVSILRRVRTNRHATHTSAHAFVHADGRNGGHKASLKTTFFFSVMLRCAPRTKRSPLPPCSVFISHSFLVRRLSYVSFSFSVNRACTFVRFPSFFLSFFLSIRLSILCRMFALKHVLSDAVTRAFCPPRKTRSTCSGCHAGWPPSPPAAICFSLSRRRGRL